MYASVLLGVFYSRTPSRMLSTRTPLPRPSCVCGCYQTTYNIDEPKEQEEPSPTKDSIEAEKVRPLLKKSRVEHDPQQRWEDTSFLPLPSEKPDDDDDELDLIADARDIVLNERKEPPTDEG